jgi:Fic family protein
MTQGRIIPQKTTKLRCLWLAKLGGIDNVSVRNKEWMTLLEEDTRNSLMIEGYFVSRAEIKDIIENPKYSRDAYKVLGYFDSAVASYELAFQQYKTGEFKVTQSIIRQMHSLMFRGDPHFVYSPGEWRKGAIEITGAKVETSSPFKIEEHIKILIGIINKPGTELTRKVAIVHDMFEQIHPFPDGNGRVGRILLNFILVGHGLPNIAIKGSGKNKKIYIDALEEADPVISKILKGESKKKNVSKPLIKLEDLVNKSLAISMDVIICNRFDKIKTLMPLKKLAEILNKPIGSIRVACSQKKHICSSVNGAVKTHPDLLSPPPAN